MVLHSFLFHENHSFFLELCPLQPCPSFTSDLRVFGGRFNGFKEKSCIYCFLNVLYLQASNGTAVSERGLSA